MYTSINFYNDSSYATIEVRNETAEYLLWLEVGSVVGVYRSKDSPQHLFRRSHTFTELGGKLDLFLVRYWFSSPTLTSTHSVTSSTVLPKQLLNLKLAIDDGEYDMTVEWG